ncbi:MAG: hypothetical protein B5M46_04055 [Epsilonproteobacteria bacterium 4484_20]|nr:MAG: hypothetical protein B5M46_04055 [Epsilonproteobacteria bacterium 4484_20]
MSKIQPHPTGRELKLHPKDMIVSKTDINGIISYGNKKFIEISGYSEDELIEMPHNILRHPDMPKAIFYLMWKHIKNGQNIMAVIKNMSKSGDHYWVTTDFGIQKNREGVIKSFIAFRQAAPKSVLKVIKPLYATMLEIEKEDGMEASVRYLETYLSERQMNYSQFIEDLARPSVEKMLKRYDIKFKERYLSEQEITMAGKTETLAGLWAAKEAISKALGCGIGAQLSFHDIVIAKDDKGAPYFSLTKEAQKIFRIKSSSLSISHDGGFAIAVAVIDFKKVI